MSEKLSHSPEPGFVRALANALQGRGGFDGERLFRGNLGGLPPAIQGTLFERAGEIVMRENDPGKALWAGLVVSCLTSPELREERLTSLNRLGVRFQEGGANWQDALGEIEKKLAELELRIPEVFSLRVS